MLFHRLRPIAWGLAALALSACIGPIQPPRPATPAGHAAAGDHYVVQRGDTLYSIAFRLDMNFKTLAQINDIAPPYRIYAGQRLTTNVKAAQPPHPAPGPARPPPLDAHRGTDQDAARAARPNPAQDSAKPSSPGDGHNETDKTTALLSDANIKWRWPLKGSVARAFQEDGNKGIDIAVADAGTVTAAAAGKVVYSGQGLIGYGNLVIVKHGDNYLSAYGNNSRLLAQENDDVAAGQAIAEIWPQPGRPTVLHFEIRLSGKSVNPLDYLPRR